LLDKAEEHLAAVQKATPRNQALWQTWGQLAIKSQFQEKMLKVADQGLKELAFQPWDFMPLATELFIRGGELDRAADCITKLHQQEISPPTVAFLRGLIALKKGELHGAVKSWRQSIELGNSSSQIQLMLASALSDLGDRQSSLRRLRTFVSERPYSFEGRLALAKLLARSGNWAETAEHARSAEQLSPKNLAPRLLHLQARAQLAASTADENTQTQMWKDIETRLAELEGAVGGAGAAEVKFLKLQITMLRGKFAEAQELVNQLKKEHPSKVRIAMVEAELLAARQREDEAIILLNKTIETFPEAVEPVTGLAVLLDRKGEHEKCGAVIKDALERIDKPLAHRALGLLLAQFYSRWGQEDDVYLLLNTLAQKLPLDIPIKRRLLNSMPVVKDAEKAQQLVDDIKSLEGEGGRQWRYEQARVWFNSDDFKSRCHEITSLLQENLLANPDDQASRALLGATYERGGDLQMALSTYREALERSPQNIQLIISTVAALYKAEEYDEAGEILKRVSDEKLPPTLQRLQFESYLRRGQLDPAADMLLDTVNRDPNNISASLSLALLRMWQNKFDEAGTLLDELQAKEPNSLPIMMTQIQLNVRQGKAKEAIDLCNKIVNELNNASAYIIRASTFASLGQPDKAIEDFGHAIAVEPNSVDAWVARSNYYRSTGQSEKAIDDIEQALSLGPDNVQVQKRAITLLMASGNRDRVEQVRAILDQALESNPKDGVLKLYKAQALLGEGTAPSIEEAAQMLQEITEEQPKISQAWVLLGEILLSQGQAGKAMDTALQGLVHNANNRGLLMLKADAEKARSPVLAIPTLKELLDRDPNDVDAAIRLSEIYTATGEVGKAVSILRKQLTTCEGPNRQRCKIALAVALYRSGNKADAQKEFDSLLLEDIVTQLTVAKTLMVIGDNEAMKTAEDILRKILEEHPKSVETISTLAMLLQTLNNTKEAAELYQSILTIQPDNVIAMNNLAWIMCEQQGKHKQALELAQKGFEIQPNYIDIIDTRGVAYYRLGEFEKAIQDFATCIKRYPIGATAVSATYFHLGRAFAKLEQTDKAIENLNKALELNNKTGGLPATDLDEAKRLLEQLSKERG